MTSKFPLELTNRMPRGAWMAGAILLTTLVPLQQPQAAAKSPLPFICMYGHSDNAGVTDAFRKLGPRINVI